MEWMADMKLEDIIDKDMLQKFQDDFARSFNISCITLDASGKGLTKVSNPTEFCEKYTRKSRVGNGRCKECDLRGVKESIASGAVEVYRCHAGLIDFAVPIIVHGKHLGGIYGGQVSDKYLEEKDVRELAVELRIDQDEYVKSAERVPIISEDSIKLAGEILSIFIDNMTDIGKEKFLFRGMFNTLKERVDRANKLSNKLEVFSNEVEREQSRLNKEVQVVTHLSHKIDETSEFIKQIAKQTNILGLNAAIQAGRDSSNKNGFGIIAKEIRSLSDKSRNTVDGIIDTNNKIQRSIENTKLFSKKTLELTEKQKIYVTEVNGDLSEALKMAASLNR